MVDQEILDSQLKAGRFPFPSQGNITLRVRNANYTLGPVMLHVVMNPGATIPAIRLELTVEYFLIDHDTVSRVGEPKNAYIDAR